MTIHVWDPDLHREDVRDLYTSAGKEGPHESHFPPLGILAEEDGEILAAMWAYQSLGCGVAFVEWLVTRGGIRWPLKLRAVRAAYWGIEKILHSQGYDCVRVSFLDIRLMRLATRLFGFVEVAPVSYNAIKNIPNCPLSRENSLRSWPTSEQSPPLPPSQGQD